MTNFALQRQLIAPTTNLANAYFDEPLEPGPTDCRRSACGSAAADCRSSLFKRSEAVAVGGALTWPKRGQLRFAASVRSDVSQSRRSFPFCAR